MTHVFPSGVKEVFEITLASGRRLTASANHPFLTASGWTRLDQLAPKGHVAVPRKVPTPLRTAHWPDDEIVMLAHMLGDGCVAPRQPVHYTSADEENLLAVEKAATHFGITPRRVRLGNWTHVYLPSPRPLTHGVRNPIQEWLSRYGLDCKRSHEKFVPGDVFSLEDSQLALFLRHLWATDGCVSVQSTRVALYYTSTSRRFVDGVQQLLLRFGINSTIRTVRKASHRHGFQLWIYDGDQQLAFLREHRHPRCARRRRRARRGVPASADTSLVSRQECRRWFGMRFEPPKPTSVLPTSR